MVKNLKLGKKKLGISVVQDSKVGSVTPRFINNVLSPGRSWRNEPIQSRGNRRVHSSTISPGLAIVHGISTWNKAGLVYRATPSDDRPGADMLGGAGPQQMPEIEMNLSGCPSTT